MSNKIVEYKDLIAFHPGQYVEELIEDYSLTQKEFAERLGVSSLNWCDMFVTLVGITFSLANFF